MYPPQVAPGSLSTPSSMGRKRTVNHDLPPRMARKGERYYYVCNAPRKWIPLGKDLPRAKREWAELEAGTPQGLSVGELVQRYIDRSTLAEGTHRQYKSFHKAIAEAFPIQAAQLTSQHVALWRDLQEQRSRKTYVNGCLCSPTRILPFGRRARMCVPLTVRAWTLVPRDLYLTDDEYLAIRERALEWLQIAMDLAYLTAARRGDVLSLGWEDIQSGHLTMRQRKTGQRMSFRVTMELSSILERARKRRVLGLRVVAGERGRPISHSTLGRAWLLACKAAGVVAQFRDIRSKAATDAKAGGQDYQKLLGHTTLKMSERYIKGRTTVVAEPVRRKL